MNAILAPRELSPHEAYVLAENQKAQVADDFFQQITKIYNQGKAGQVPEGLERKRNRVEQNKQSEALKFFIDSVDEKLATMQAHGTKGKNHLPQAIRLAYRETAVKYGLKQVDPTSPAFKKDLKEFHTNYLPNFPIPSEQESRKGFENLWTAPTLPNGYKEVGYSLVCPLTGKFLMGTNFSIQPESNSVHFTYGFVTPWARGALGFSRALKDTMKQVATKHSTKYPSKFPGDPIITFEKNVLGEMTLGDILMDTAGIDINKPPVEGANLAMSSIAQSIRDMIWSRRGGKVVGYKYIQSSLDGVVKIEDPEQEKLVIRMLRDDKTLDDKQRKLAQKILKKARAGKVEGCTTLNLCVFMSDDDTKKVPAAQIAKAMEIFQGISVVKDPVGIKDDVYFKASMEDLRARTDKSGMVRLQKIPAFGGNIPEVRNFVDAEALTKLLLQHVTYEELRANQDRPYAEWLDKKLEVVAPAFAAHKAEEAARKAPRRGADTGMPAPAAALGKTNG
jgi:hypothetical protein